MDSKPTTSAKGFEIPKLFGGKRQSRRQSRKSRHGETDRKRQHKGGKSRRTSRKSRHTSRK